uniref:Probable cell surface adhesin n=1 Tax=uncultured haloarchaeon TaxID=160804 RepID=A5YT30_9EURY|nr:probable cell surface adhesin [uncultured haloarchaeon]
MCLHLISMGIQMDAPQSRIRQGVQYEYNNY